MNVFVQLESKGGLSQNNFKFTINDFLLAGMYVLYKFLRVIYAFVS